MPLPDQMTVFRGPLRCSPPSSRRSTWIDPKQETFPLKSLSSTKYHFPHIVLIQTHQAPRAPKGLKSSEFKSVPFSTLLTLPPLVWSPPPLPPCPASLPRWAAHSLRPAFQAREQWMGPEVHRLCPLCLGTRHWLTLRLVWAASSIFIDTRAKGLDSGPSTALWPGQLPF